MDVDKVEINSLRSQFSKYKKDLLGLNKYMYENPELGYQEIKSVNKITKLIKKHTADVKFKIKSDFKPAGDQPEAIKKLVNGANKEEFNQVLLGVTGSGKLLQWQK